jgi:tetratricopeptide (TPR) repeat protein
LKPRQRDNYHFQLNCLNRRSDYKEIIAVSQQGLKYYPKDIALREYLILGYLKTGKRDRAMNQMKQVLKSQPKNAAMLLRLGQLQEKEGQLTEAINTFQKLSKIAPNHKEAGATYPRLLLQLAKAQEKQGKKKQALVTYRKLMEISPDNEDAEEAYLRLRMQVLPHGK